MAYLSKIFLRDIACILAVLICLSASGADGSEKPPDRSVDASIGLPQFSFGFKAGLSLAQHSGVNERDAEYEVKSHWRKGFAAGLYLHLPVNSRFGLQQEILFAQRGSRQDITVDILDVPTVLNVTYDMDYIEIPVLLRFTWARWSGGAFHSYAGTALSFKIHDRYTLEGEIDDGVEQVPLRADSDMSEVEMFDYSFVYGFGLDLQLMGRRILFEYRFVIGWNRLQMPTYAYVPFEDEDILIDNDPVPLKNQNHLLMIGVEF